MSQQPAIAWNEQPTVTNTEPPATLNAEATSPTAEVKTESFADLVEKEAQNQIVTIKMASDRTRLNAAVGVRVAELVKELGLPPPRTEEETIEELTRSKLDEFEMQRLNFKATEKAREIFFDRHPDMRTQEKKQTVPDATATMTQSLMDAFLRFLGHERHQAEKEAAREAAKARKAS
jgi:hypothetical protein